MIFFKIALLSVIMFFSGYCENRAISTFSVHDTVSSSNIFYDSLKITVNNCVLDNGIINFDLNVITKNTKSKKILLEDDAKLDVIARLVTANEDISNFNSILLSQKISVELSRIVDKETIDSVYLNNFNIIEVNK